MGDDASPSNNVRLIGALAGVGSGLTKVAVGHGFDTIKTRLQCSPPGVYRGALDCFMKTVRNESVLALYKGATPPAVGWAAIDSVLLGSLHNYRLFLLRHGMTEPAPSADVPRLTILAHGIAGLFAGLTSGLGPVLVKLQLQLQRAAKDRQFKGPIHCARQIVSHQGVLGLWTGFGGSLAFRSNFFWMFLSFETLMRTFTRLEGTRYEMSTGLANFLSGGLSSFAFWSMAIPADNIKNRMMSSPMSSPRQHVFAVANTIYHTYGVPGFFKGLTPCLLRAFPTNACAFFVYEGLMRAFGAEKTRH